MTSDSIDKLYENYGILAEAKDKVTEHEKEYLEILAAVKGTDKEKRLASQFIAKFFGKFPALADQALEALFDLCEDDDVAIRKQAIKDLPALCKENKDHTQRIADILAQLLQSDDTAENSIVSSSLLNVLRHDPMAALKGIFAQMQASENEILHERCIKFMASKVKQLGREVINKECEDFIIAEGRKVFEDIIAEEFDHIMELLTWSRLGKTPAGQRELVAMVAAQAFSGDDWQPNEPECVARVLQCTTHALRLFSPQVPSTQFVEFFCDHILPSLNVLKEPEHLELLKQFAELTQYSGELTNPEEKLQQIHDVLLSYCPEAPEPGAEDVELKFSHVEAALFALHSICRLHPTLLDSEKLKALRLKLQYPARLAHAYAGKLQEVTKDKKPTTEEEKLKIVALKTTSNISTMIKDMFRTPPTYKTKVTLSFQVAKRTPIEEKTQISDKSDSLTSQKRHKPITFDSNTDNDKGEKRRRSDSDYKMYQPPSGKYSQRISGGGRYSGGGGGNRGGFRSRGGAGFRRRF